MLHNPRPTPQKSRHEPPNPFADSLVVRAPQLLGSVKGGRMTWTSIGCTMRMHFLPRAPLSSSCSFTIYNNFQAPSSSAQLLLAPPFAALSSSIFATLFLNSTYWHFSYECLSSYNNHSQPCTACLSRASIAYHAFPRQVILFESTPIEGNKEVGAAVSVGYR